MKVRVSVIIPIIIIFVSCSKKDPDRCYNGKGGFSIEFPKDWEIKEDYMGSLVMALSPLKNSQDDFRENIIITIEKLSKDMTIDEYLDFNMAKLGKFFTDFKELKRGDWIFDDNDAKWVLCSCRMGVYDICYLLYVAIVEGKAYSLYAQVN